MTEIPGLTKGEFGFEGWITLEAWAGFQTRNGPYGSVSSSETSDGICRMDTGGDMADEDPKILNAHVKAYEYLVTNQDEIKQNILNLLMSEYPNLQDSYGYGDDEKKEYMPDVADVSEFKNLIGLSSVHLMDVEKDGVAYVGYEFGCTWDEEHGFGVMTHKSRIIDFGGADSSFMTWIAEKDLPN